jgi:hypothetical protein
MTGKEILTGLVEKAREGGFMKNKDGFEICGKYIVFYNEKAPFAGYDKGMTDIERLTLSDLITNRPFMEAVYGSEMVCIECGNLETSLSAHNYKICDHDNCIPAHHYHAQQLIILSPDERLKYIERGIK